eukprot:TRINITY_DN10740_c0_g2_i1.p1 TRINITY_DN10740_c0_g2~~TRINITY_DN10740_c0_g2_i1.p1  ORF type:complete len:628 (+),score=143.99 TRINITY_DN10740_c0_g2_i1:48-1886(+)
MADAGAQNAASSSTGEPPDPDVLDVKWSNGRLVYAGQVPPGLSGDVVKDQQEAPYPKPVLNLVGLTPELMNHISEQVLHVSKRKNHPELARVLQRCLKGICPHAAQLLQSDHDVVPTQCNEPICDITHNLWLCLHCGYVACGRIRYFSEVGDGGNGHALHHWKTNPDHVLCVKLGTVTETDSDTYCYLCEQLVQDPYLHRHLAKYGIDRRKQTLTCPRVSDMWHGFGGDERKEPLVYPRFVTKARRVRHVMPGLANEPLIHAIMYIGDPHEVLRTLMLVSKGLHQLVLDCFAMYVVSMDLSKSAPEHAHLFFKCLNIPLQHLKWNKMRAHRALAIPDYPDLRTVILQDALWDSSATQFFTSLTWLDNITVLSVRQCEGADWSAVMTAHRKGAQFQKLKALDLFESNLYPEHLLALLEMTGGTLEALRIGSRGAFLTDRPYHREEFMEINREVLENVVTLAPNLEFFEFVSDPRLSEDLPSNCYHSHALRLPHLRTFIFSGCEWTSPALRTLLERCPDLSFLQLATAQSTAAELAALLSAHPDLRICPKVRVSLELVNAHGVSTSRLVAPVVAQRLFDAKYLAEPASTVASPPPPPDRHFTGTASCVVGSRTQ